MTASEPLAGITARELLDRASAVLIDLDGTLVDSTQPVGRVWAAFAQRHGLDPDEVHHFAQGRPSHETVRLLLPEGDHGSEAAAVEEAEINDPDGVRALPGAARLLRSGRRLAIVTSCSAPLARMRLITARLPIPDVLVSSDQLVQGKPDPECFLEGARRLGVPAVDCVVIEDAPAGISAGRAAGAAVIAVRTTHDDHELADAHVVVDDVASLVD